MSISKVQELVDAGEFELTQYLNASNLYMKLTTLYLVHDPAFYDGNQIIDKLTNMPVLGHLLIQLNNVSFDDLELLHRNIPSLNKLNLQPDRRLIGDLPNDIATAPLLSNFSLFNHENHDAEILIKWTRYVIAKYPQLTKATFSVFKSVDSTERNNVFKHGVFPLLKVYGAQIKSLMVNALLDNVNLFVKMDEFNCQLKEFGHLLGRRSVQVLKVFAKQTK